MPIKKRTSDQPIGVGLTAKQFKRKKPVNADYLIDVEPLTCLLYTSPSPRDGLLSRMPSSA